MNIWKVPLLIIKPAQNKQLSLLQTPYACAPVDTGWAEVGNFKVVHLPVLTLQKSGRLEILTFNIFEIINSADFKLNSGRIIADDDALWV
jgi:hypothetical protein